MADNKQVGHAKVEKKEIPVDKKSSPDSHWYYLVPAVLLVVGVCIIIAKHKSRAQ